MLSRVTVRLPASGLRLLMASALVAALAFQSPDA
jgi:hypothetical protein